MAHLRDAAYLLYRLFPGAFLMSATSRASAQLGDGSFPSILVLPCSVFPHSAEGSRLAWLLEASAGVSCSPAPEGAKQWREGGRVLELVGLGVPECSSGTS